MKGYVFTYGVDGFGADIAPAHEEGCYLNYDEAFAHLVELNTEVLKNKDVTFYEDGYGEDYFPETDKELLNAEENEDWDKFEKLMEKHTLTNIAKICKKIMSYDEPPFGFYSMEEIEIKQSKEG